MPIQCKELPQRSLRNEFRLIQELGRGSFGYVVLAKSTLSTGEMVARNGGWVQNTLLEPLYSKKDKQNIVAIKTLVQRCESMEGYMKLKEVSFALSVPSHGNLVQLYDIFVDRLTRQLHLVMEPMQQSLCKLMSVRTRFFSARTLRSILSQVLAALVHIHGHGFFHRDIKPENILVSTTSSYYDGAVPFEKRGHSYVVKLTDFGLSRNKCDFSKYTNYVSTRWYRAPEILLRQPRYSSSVDMWAFGTVAVEATIFRPLFPGDSEQDQIWRILRVLGTPAPRAYTYGYASSSDTVAFPGGTWNTPKELQNVPRVAGVDISLLMRRPDFSSQEMDELLEIVRACLLWDVDKRATAKELRSMSYFRGLESDDKENHPEGNSLFKMIEGVLPKGRLGVHNANVLQEFSADLSNELTRELGNELGNSLMGWGI